MLDIDLISRGVESKALYPQHAGDRQERHPRGRADRHLPRHAAGEPPTLETAETLFNSLFFDNERYDCWRSAGSR